MKVSNNLIALIAILLVMFSLFSMFNILSKVNFITGKNTVDGIVQLRIISSCGDGICSIGEDCPADAAYCTDNKCYEPTCTNGCSQIPVAFGQTDEACYSNIGCDGSNCLCNGNGVCVVPTVVPSTGPGGGGGGAGGGGKGEIKIASLDIVLPSTLVLYPNDEISIPIILKNSGQIMLENIILSTETDKENIFLRLSKTRLSQLSVGNIEKLNLIVVTKDATLPGYVRIMAQVENPALTQVATLYIDALRTGVINTKDLRTRIEAAKQLFRQNPECLELNELIAQSEKQFDSEEYEKSSVLIDEATKTCKDLLSKKAIEKPKKIINWYLILIGFGIFIILILLLIYILLVYRKAKK
ncbi:MAG: hypothetical protein NT139_02490 [Candidatus Woesearchaeota archaeon]|nr:hypothetical protein [Candidatus Woesearchaeota archaeon]